MEKNETDQNNNPKFWGAGNSTSTRKVQRDSSLKEKTQTVLAPGKSHSYYKLQVKYEAHSTNDSFHNRLELEKKFTAASTIL